MPLQRFRRDHRAQQDADQHEAGPAPECSGTFMGRPASAATATASIEPETRPPGKPIS